MSAFAPTTEALLEALDSAGIGCTVVVERGASLERVYANAAIARVFGLDVQAMRALPPDDTLTTSERARLVALSSRDGVPRVIETFIHRPDGSEIPVEVGLGHAVIDGARASFVFVRDISAKAEIEAALRESKERFRLLAEACPDSITVYRGGHYIYANPVARRFLGIGSETELAAFDSWSTVPEDRRAAITEMVKRVKAGEKIAPLRNRVRMPDGREVVFESSISFASLEGETAILSYSRDVTERLRLQAELMKQDRLASVGLLAAGVAHELNNPLAALALQARRLCEEADKHGFDATVRESLTQIDEAATRMRTIIADLLFLSRPVDKPQAHVAVADILRSTIALLRAGAPTVPTVDDEIEALPAIEGYPSKLGQVFLNVLRNAVQATEGREDGRISVRARPTEAGVEVVIADNGPGVPAHLRGRIAQPFFTTKRDGTGLGLWISSELVRQHGGSLDVLGDDGKGTRVAIRLPFAASSAAEAPASRGQESEVAPRR